MSTLPKRKYTPEEYLEIDRKAEHKSQYLDGEIFAKVGASEWHNLIVTNLVGELRSRLKGRTCRVYPSDMRVKVQATGLYTYPDVTGVCGEAVFEDEKRDTLLNPGLVIEVLSPSTEGYDRGRKFEHYRQIDSLAEYVLVAQDKHHVERFRRQGEHEWLFWETSSLQQTVELPSIECELPLSEIYDKVEISPPSNGSLAAPP
jgi:Uma2 family endonuclease